jgi:hypothetical protein
MMNWCKDKSKLNLVIDAIMLVFLMAIAGLGFLIKYVLIPGYKRNSLYQGDVELYFLGLDRHEWGSIHLWLSFVFLALMILHIALHWKMITCIFSRMFRGKASRVVIAVFTGIVALFLSLGTLFVKPQVVPFQVKHIHSHHIEMPLKKPDSTKQEEIPVIHPTRQIKERLHKNQGKYGHGNTHDALEVYGYMTLDETAKKYSISVIELTDALNIPINQSSEKIGRLKRWYGFEMEEIKDTIIKLKNKY